MADEKACNRKWLVFAATFVLYWVALPFVLVFLAMSLDLALSFSSISAMIAIPIGGILLLTSLILSCWCAVALYLRGGGFPLAFLPPVRLVREGPYALSRHPLYLAFTGYLLGLGLLVRSVASVTIIVPDFFLLWIAYTLLHEERVLARRYGNAYDEYKKNVPFFFRPRRNVPGPGIVFTIVYLLGKVIVRLLFPLDVEGEENLPHSGPYILLCNHASYLDPVFLVAASSRYVRFFTTGEMMRTRVGRWFFTAMGSIPTSRYRVDSASVRAFLTALKGGEIVGLFPEGERTWDGNPLPISPTVRRLLKRVGVPLVPAHVEGSYAIYPRWSGYPLPGRITVRFFPPFSPDSVSDTLFHVSIPVAGHTRFPRSTRGLERLIWACPACRTIGGITARGREIRCGHCHAEWSLDRSLNVHASDGTRVPLREFVSFLTESNFFLGRGALASIGPVDLLVGGEEVSHVASGEVVYRDGALHVGERSFSISEARIIRLEGKNRLDLGFAQDRRLRIVFHRDSPLKWERFLRAKLGLEP
ncbi:MAG: 1-acyl-sn-glycerol-3-phosphate acyltransferase [Candidatus Bipolaricaulota bacterium]|nr:1-acyl-sn-glycerol-3-phosphate acyltransferase [Candidatus Bipolaricaulota bacterium]